MCGIAGLIYSDAARPCSAETVVAMRDLVHYRGPDDAGLYLEGPLGLGHRRLSIIDLGGGHQPMADVSGHLHIIFNGEIYNYRPLREELVNKGYAFHTHSDTEVILNLYAEVGEACVQQLNGMFAFALWDARRRSLFLARDRMGVKPLYYAQTPEALVFGSEVKSLFASGLVTARLREEAVAEYLQFRQVAGDTGLFKGVRSLPPGCTMTVTEGRARTTRFWTPHPPRERTPVLYEQALEQLTELFDDSVRLRLISDVPVGTFCSGGVDSSLVTAVAARLKGGSVDTYSIGFDEEGFDESEYARIAARHAATTHHELQVGNVEFDELLPRMVWHNDEPLDFANSVHIFALSDLAKRRVTVVLTGEGSDELFAGYPRYQLPGFAKSFRPVPAPLRQLLSAVVPDHRMAKLKRYAAMSAEDALLLNASYLDGDLVRQLAPGLPIPSLEFRRACLAATAGLDDVSRLTLLDQETFLVGILNRQDKMSMAAGIESRVPFMDYRIVEFANRLPASFKVRGRTGKALVKDLARTQLPAEIVDRRKSGFGVPLAAWFRATTGLGARLAGLADEAESDIIDRGVLRRLVTEHQRSTADHSEVLWTILNLVMWRKAFGC